MVRAILAGSKTQTRRVLKGSTEHRGPYNPAYVEAHRNSAGWATICPYGAPGDRLWVREAYRFDRQFDALTPRRVPPGSPFFMEASLADWLGGPHDGEPGKLRPSMFMPRWASRITLEVTEVRVERLQDISEADALAEGVWTGQPEMLAAGAGGMNLNHRSAYASLWEQINGPASWDANPWVWAISFKRVHENTGVSS